MGVSTLEWRDSQGIQTMPETQYDVPIVFKADSTVKKVYLCSPDFQSIAMKPVVFVQSGDELRFTLDSLKIWDMVVMEFESKPTAIDSEPKSVKTFKLMPNYPNPFNATTLIRFTAKTRKSGGLKVFNNTGQKIEDRQITVAPGYNEVPFHSFSLPSGIYFYQLKIGAQVGSAKMILLK